MRAGGRNRLGDVPEEAFVREVLRRIRRLRRHADGHERHRPQVGGEVEDPAHRLLPEGPDPDRAEAEGVDGEQEVLDGGGHVLECAPRRVRAGIQFIRTLELSLPMTADYLSLDFRRPVDRDLQTIEK